ncbi:hypothetical protein U0070_019244 [Myodes glareolus]|uniref:Uncharacterized protein n=1 Tax=Myodes glareolus TaxID=447135 RepID=A0AAW0IWB3_MYOGA
MSNEAALDQYPEGTHSSGAQLGTGEETLEKATPGDEFTDVLLLQQASVCKVDSEQGPQIEGFSLQRLEEEVRGEAGPEPQADTEDRSPF